MVCYVFLHYVTCGRLRCALVVFCVLLWCYVPFWHCDSTQYHCVFETHMLAATHVRLVHMAYCVISEVIV
jgi:hypothetical protein